MRIHLTEKGEKTAELALYAVMAADQDFLDPLGQPERDSVASILKVLLLRHEPS